MSQRNTNIELLRVVAMLIIVLHHFVYHGLGLYQHMLGHDKLDLSLNFDVAVLTFINAFLIVGVNIFVLISGYFSIKAKVSSVVKLYLMCSFWAVVSYVISSSFKDTLSIPHIFSVGLFPFSRGPWWFMRSYFCLLLISPFVNRYIQETGRRGLLYGIVVFAFINVYLGWIHGMDNLNTGYNFINFLLLYLIGSYLSLLELKKKRMSYFVYYLFFSLLLGGSCVLCCNYGMEDKLQMMFSYNNPLIIFSAVSLFCVFAVKQMKFSKINTLSSCILVVYLFQEGGVNCYKQIGEWNYSNNILFTVFLWIVCVLFSFCIPICIECVRRKLMKPFESYIITKLSELAYNMKLTDEKGKVSI